MSNSISYQQLLLNQVSIPIKLLADFTSLGLDEKEVMIVIQLHRFIQEKKEFPTPFEIAADLTLSEKECANLLRKLIQKNLLTIYQQHNEMNQISEAYSLDPLWEKLFAEKRAPENPPEDGSMFILFEQEFGRPLSPFEIETINAWLDEDQIAPSLIKAGLRESVLMGKLNFKYIDRILREWKKKGIHSVEQAREASKKFHHRQETSKEPVKQRDTSFYYNWLEGEE
ncbi:DnaD domain-containing protein [Virgibacillus xinjiangensis]|uniref:DnaD domain-containing protein n=1 Tax=Virgibacillus xinjiangensis TaxID=393090 RepID=A0ABV7CRJ3_9BACI